MCRNIHTLHNFEPAATNDEVNAAALQYVRKIAGTTKPSKANQEAFDRAVHEIAHITGHLLQDLVAVTPPKNREEEAAKARRARSLGAVLRGLSRRASSRWSARPDPRAGADWARGWTEMLVGSPPRARLDGPQRCGCAGSVMRYIDISRVSYGLPDGRPLLDEVSFRVGEGSTTALIGANGAGKTTLLRIIRGDEPAHGGVVSIGGALGVMDQFVGHGAAGATVHELLIDVAPRRIRDAARRARGRRGRDHRERRPRGAAAVRDARSPTTRMPAATSTRRSGTSAPSPRSACRSSARGSAS